PADHVIRHYDVTGKLCPGMIGWNADSGSEAEWEDFRKAISGSAPTYSVQVGAFSDRGNAEKYLEAVRKSYPDAFIRTVR
ncbi:MAG: SPOR domain-containing protein, partial [Oscillospiraceae bacterium]